MGKITKDALLSNERFKQALVQEVCSRLESQGVYDCAYFKQSILKSKVIRQEDLSGLKFRKTAGDQEIVWYCMKHHAELSKRSEALAVLLKELHVIKDACDPVVDGDLLYDKAMVSLYKIEHVSEFIAYTRDHAAKSHHYYFRGQTNINYEPLPSIYRNIGHTLHEQQMYQEALVEFPSEFKDCTTDFEKLVQMQHQKLGTRLLDITTNPLVALYFACAKSEQIIDNQACGRVFVFMSKQLPLFPDSDRISLIASLGFLKYEDQKEIWRHSALEKEAFNQCDSTQRLIHRMVQHKGNFIAKIEPDDLKDIYFVKACKNNDRIIRQHGLFLITGLFFERMTEQQNQEEAALIPSLHDVLQGIHSLYWKNENNHKVIVCCVEGRNKKRILEELKMVGISKKDLFPDLNEAAEQIKEKYREVTIR